MARLIVKSPYIKCSAGAAGAGGYLHYIGTREHVQKLTDDRSAVSQREGYMQYIATRPRAERLTSHGLFSDEDNVDLNQAMSELDSYTGNVWTHIISLRREDAARHAFGDAAAPPHVKYISKQLSPQNRNR